MLQHPLCCVHGTVRALRQNLIEAVRMSSTLRKYTEAQEVSL